MRCVQINETGQLVDVNPQPVSAVDCLLVVGSPSELASPFAISVEDALAITPSIVLVWSIAFGWVMVKKALKTADVGHNEEA